jgi:putative NADH-flavin reductase
MHSLGCRLKARIAIVLTAILLCACVSTPGPGGLPTVDERSYSANKDVTLAILGATGMVGGFLLEQALEQGYQLRVLARTPAKLDSFKGRITVVEGDARDSSAIGELLLGSDVVLSALGPVKADGNAARMLNTSVTRSIIDLMPSYGIQRYILVSGAAVSAPGDDHSFTGWLVQKSAALTLHSALVDKQAEYALLADSSIAWTSIRCPVIKAKPYQWRPQVSLETPGSFTLRAGELAHFMLEQVDSAEFIGMSPFLSSR